MLASIGGQLHNTGTVVALWLPRLFAFAAILILGYFVAKLVAGLILRLLGRAGLDRTVHSGTGGPYIQKVVPRPSNLVSRIAFWVLFLGAVSLAASVLKIAAVTAFIGAVFAYIPNVIAAILIFLVAGAISGAVVALVQRTMGDTGTGKILSAIAPALVMGIAIFMILEQLRIAHDIVVTTYTLLLGAIALAAALAFGLGGRDVAGRMLEGAYQAGQENKDQMKEDLNQGIQRGKQDAQQVKDRVETESDSRPGAVGSIGGGTSSGPGPAA
jgi:Mechanosensitive ion channel, conserved TM helix